MCPQPLQSTLRPHSRVASDYTPSQLSNKTASSINTSTRSKLTHSPTKTSLLDSPQRITGVNKCACSSLCGVKGRPVSSPRPLSRTAVRYSVGVNTVSTSETTTQTPVDVATQTDKSKVHVKLLLNLYNTLHWMIQCTCRLITYFYICAVDGNVFKVKEKSKDSLKETQLE